MIGTVENTPEVCVIESDNCSSQYKSAQHFDDIQFLSNQYGMIVIRLFSVAGHGKGEVDHVGGLAKCAILCYVGTGGQVFKAGDCKEFLLNKFGKKTNPIFFIEELQTDEVAERRVEARQKKYPTIERSDSFQVMVFTPNSTSFRSAPYLCVCGTCMQEYGSCSLFSSYQLKTVELKKICLRTVDDSVCDREDLEDGDSVSDDFLLPGTLRRVFGLLRLKTV